MKVIVLGASGYVGAAFAQGLREAGLPFLPLSRAETDGYHPKELLRAIRSSGASFLINAAGYTGKPNVDACESRKAECLEGNAVLPGKVREACEEAGIRWGQVSSGCIYSGRRADGKGFREDDPPNFSFRNGPCSFYSGSKALGEEVLADARDCYIWRLRIPFDHHDGPRNYLSKLLRYERLFDAENSISHLGDFVKSCLRCIEGTVQSGIYNLTNPGVITTRQVAGLLAEHIAPDKEFRFFDDEADFMDNPGRTWRSNCVMDTTKAEAAGIAMRPVEDALADAVGNFRKS
jgi:dTDP-4-dehydrorhamnose reductase